MINNIGYPISDIGYPDILVVVRYRISDIRISDILISGYRISGYRIVSDIHIGYPNIRYPGYECCSFYRAMLLLKNKK